MIRSIFVLGTLLAASPAAAYSYNYALGFGAIPSDQGWDYLASGTGANIPASALFSVNGSALFQDTIGIPLGQGGANTNAFHLGFAVGDFSLTMVSALRQAETSYPYGFSFGISTKNGYYDVGIGDTYAIYQVAGGSYPSGFDVHAFHTYNITRQSGIASFSIDGQVLYTGPGSDYPGDVQGDYLKLGDDTGYSNASAVVTSYVFAADPIPEPASVALLGGSLAAFAAMRRRATRRNRENRPGTV